jgi:hypothetical protein
MEDFGSAKRVFQLGGIDQKKLIFTISNIAVFGSNQQTISFNF